MKREVGILILPPAEEVFCKYTGGPCSAPHQVFCGPNCRYAG